MRFKKLLAAGIAAVMAVSALAGCGGSSDSGDKQVSSDNGENTEGSSDAAGSGELVDLKWVLIGNGMPSNYDTWMPKVNEYIADKVGVNLEVEVVSWADWDSRRNVIISTNEPYDIIFGHGGNYISDINLGAYCDITDLIEENMPELNEMMPEECWTAMRVNDRIYGVPTYKDIAISNYAIWDKELVEEYNLDLAALTEVESLTPVFEQLKADKNDYPFYSKNDGIYFIFDPYDQLGAGMQVLGVRYDDQDAKVCFTLEQPDVYKALETVYDWNQKGLINPDAATLSEARVYNMWRIGQGWESAAYTSWGPQMGKDVAVQKVGDTILSNDSVRGSINMISTNSKYPEKCLQLLNLVNTDTKLRDMFYYGEEGVNFEYTEDGKVHKLEQVWDIPGYTNGSYFTVTQEDKDEYNQFAEIKELMDGAVNSVMLGFTFDTTEVYDQIANCSEIWLRYKSEVMTGVQDPAVCVPKIKEDLMAAGFQDILDEAQKQVDAFMANK
ncbi:MAG: ABC transporter substrate-binding protein [Eubacterium sp.]|nr:ABC transporter substrate-binding protein [Eubacterium sp.]